jgi:tight adherence protein B
MAMNALTWLAVGLGVISWPTSSRAVRLRALAASGRLMSVASPASARPDWPRSPGWPFAFAAGLGAGAAADVVGGRSAGVAVGTASAIAASAMLHLARDAARSRSTHRQRDDLHLALTVLCGELEAGTTPAIAVAAASEAVPRYAAELAMLLVAPQDCGALRPVAVAWQIAEGTGAPLAQVLARVRADVDGERALHRAVATAVAAPRSSAALLAVLPLVGVGLGAAIGARPLSVLVGTPAGHVMLVLGVLLDALGMVWTTKIIRRAQPRAPVAVR